MIRLFCNKIIIKRRHYVNGFGQCQLSWFVLVLWWMKIETLPVLSKKANYYEFMNY
jgi:hypothetical protein